MTREKVMAIAPRMASVAYAACLVVVGLFHFYPTRYLLVAGWGLLVLAICLSGFVGWRTAVIRLCLLMLTILLIRYGSHGKVLAGASIVLGIPWCNLDDRT